MKALPKNLFNGLVAGITLYILSALPYSIYYLSIFVGGLVFISFYTKEDSSINRQIFNNSNNTVKLLSIFITIIITAITIASSLFNIRGSYILWGIFIYLILYFRNIDLISRKELKYVIFDIAILRKEKKYYKLPINLDNVCVYCRNENSSIHEIKFQRLAKITGNIFTMFFRSIKTQPVGVSYCKNHFKINTTIKFIDYLVLYVAFIYLSAFHIVNNGFDEPYYFLGYLIISVILNIGIRILMSTLNPLIKEVPNNALAFNRKTGYVAQGLGINYFISFDEKLVKVGTTNEDTYEELKNIKNVLDKDVSDDLKELWNLHLIISHKKSNENIKLKIQEISTNKNAALKLIDNYKRIFDTDIVDELKKLSTSYSSIKDYLSVFINYEILDKDYPHNYIN